MKKLLTLMRMQMGSVVSFLNVGTQKTAEQRKKNTSSLFIMIGAFFLFSFISVTYNILYGYVLNDAGRIDLLPGMMLAVVSIVTLVTSIYKVNGTLYGFKDYDMVMSYPVKTSTIVACRMLLFYIINLFFVVIVMVPSFIVYGVLAKPGAYFYLTAAVSFLFIPLIPMILAAVIGTVVALISARFRKNNIVSIILMVLFFIVIFVGSMMMQNDTQIIMIGEALNNVISKIYPPAILYLKGVCGQEVLYLLIFILISGATFTIFCFIIGKSFCKINNKIASIRTKSRYVRKEQKRSTPTGALLKKEFRRLLSSVNYFMNTAVGIVMLLLAAGALWIFREDVVTTLTSTEGMNLPVSLPQLAAIAMCFLIGMVNTSACSLSLEGTSLWIIKTAPVPAKCIFRAKIYMNILLAAPAIVISGILFCLTLKANIPEALLMFLLPVSYSALVSVFDMKVNIRFARFDWKNELAVVKQGMAPFIALFAPMLFLVLFIAIFFVANMAFGVPGEIILLLFTLIFGGLALFLIKNLDKKAESKLKPLL